VGLIAYGQRRVFLQPDRGDRQLSKILSTLAVLRAVGGAGLAEVLSVEGHEFSRHMTVVCVTPATTLRWVDALRELRYRGVAGMAVIVDATSFGAAAPSEPVLAALAMRNIATRVVRQGDDLATAMRG
jgi:uncharacterized protein (DUF58 family)